MKVRFFPLHPLLLSLSPSLSPSPCSTSPNAVWCLALSIVCVLWHLLGLEKICAASERVDELKRELERVKTRIAQMRTREYPMMLERARLICGGSKREMALARDLVEHYEPEIVGNEDKEVEVHGDELVDRVKKWRERTGELRLKVDRVREDVTKSSNSLGDAVYVAQKIVLEKKPVEIQDGVKEALGDPGPPKSLDEALARDMQ
jgi:hypothetical protein